MTTALRILIILKNTFKLYKSRNFDENRIKSNKYRLRNASNVFSFLFCCVAIVWFLQCECGAFLGRSWGVLGVFIGCSQNIRNVLVLCMLHTHHTKAWFLQYKSMVFGVQKYGFCNARSGFLEFEYRVIAKC